MNHDLLKGFKSINSEKNLRETVYLVFISVKLIIIILTNYFFLLDIVYK